MILNQLTASRLKEGWVVETNYLTEGVPYIATISEVNPFKGEFMLTPMNKSLYSRRVSFDWGWQGRYNYFINIISTQKDMECDTHETAKLATWGVIDIDDGEAKLFSTRNAAEEYIEDALEDYPNEDMYLFEIKTPLLKVEGSKVVYKAV